MTDTEIFKCWCVLELMGHRRLAGYVREQEIAGHGFLRIDIPGSADHAPATQFYSPGSVYALTPTTEEIARAFARDARPEPVYPWEIAGRLVAPAAVPATSQDRADEDDEDDDRDEDPEAF